MLKMYSIYLITDQTTEAEDTSTITTFDADQDQCKTHVLSIYHFSTIANLNS